MVPLVAQRTEEHGIAIPYALLGIPRRYRPDFLVVYNNGRKQLHETKGLPLMFWLSTKIKRQSAEAYCAELGWKFRMVTKGWKRR